MLRDIIKPIHLIIAGVAILALILVGALMKVYETVNPIVIKKVPGDAKLFINDKEVWGDRTSLANGTYTVRAEKSGFATNTFTAIVNDDVRYIAATLTPSSDEAKKWAASNENAYLELERYVSSQNANSGKTLAENAPLVTQLPIEGYTYTVGYKNDAGNSSGKPIVVTIDTTAGYRNAAIGSIYNVGFDPGDYKLQFSDYTNPFEEANHATQN